MILAGMSAGGEGIEPPNAMRQTVIHQKIERPVRDRGLMPETVGHQPLQHVIGPHRPVTLQQNLQRAPAHRGQAQPAIRNHRLGAGYGARDAMMVVMRHEGSGFWL